MSKVKHIVKVGEGDNRFTNISCYINIAKGKQRIIDFLERTFLLTLAPVLH